MEGMRASRFLSLQCVWTQSTLHKRNGVHEPPKSPRVRNMPSLIQGGSPSNCPRFIPWL